MELKLILIYHRQNPSETRFIIIFASLVILFISDELDMVLLSNTNYQQNCVIVLSITKTWR